MNQPDLFAASGSRDRRPHGAPLVPQFIGALAGRGWVAGAQIATALGTDLRALRAAAHESGGRIIGNQKGYILTIEASITEVDAAVARLISQSTQMRKRALEIERVRHGRCLGGVA